MGDVARPDPEQPFFHILGPLRVLASSGSEIVLPPGRQPAVLAALLLDVNRVVGLDQLIDLLWSDDPPATARTQIQICVSALRKSLAAAGHGGVLVTRTPGYMLQVPDDRVDHRLFDSLVRHARELQLDDSRASEAVQVMRSALALWRGPALDGVFRDGLQSLATPLEEGRTSAFETLVDMQMRLGEHPTVVAEIRRMVEQHPLRERLHAQLMTVLYRSGRQAEALAAYQVARRGLINQLGIEPGAELQTLHAEILDGASAAAAPRRRDPIAGGMVRPFQLPADTADFSGRDELVAEISAALVHDGTRLAMPVIVLVGKPGIGKSALAVHVAHRLREESFPDGQLYVELGGTDGRAVGAGELLGRFARAVGAPGSAIGDGVAERGEVYRTLVAGRRMLVLLDDAASEQQVRALLPGSASCAVIVTSRTRLTGLAGAVVVELNVLDGERSRRLLAGVIGAGRVDAEPAVADALVRMVGGLPLALRIVAARLAARPRWPLSLMLERLTDERHRLDELAHGEMIVRASLAMSYDDLAPAASTLLRLLSMIDSTSYPAWVAAALLDCDNATAVELLELLVDAQMIEVASLDLDGSPRYRFHVLIRLFAYERLHDDTESAAARREAVLRLGGAWLAMTDEVHRRTYGGDYTVLHGSAARRPPEDVHVDKLLIDPLVWLEAEREHACSMVTAAAAAGADELCWDLATNLVDLFESGYYFEDWARTHRTALAVTVERRNRLGEAAVLASLGSLHLTRGHQDEAERVLLPALALFAAAGNAVGTAMVVRDLAWLDQLRGDPVAAAGGYRRALAGFQQAGDPIGCAHVLGRLAQIELDGGSVDLATALLRDALALCREAGNDRVETQIRFRLSVVAVQEGRFADAEADLDGLLDQVRSRRDVIGEAKILRQLALICSRTGRWAEAEQLLEEALVLGEGTLAPNAAVSGADHGRKVDCGDPQAADRL